MTKCLLSFVEPMRTEYKGRMSRYSKDTSRAAVRWIVAEGLSIRKAALFLAEQGIPVSQLTLGRWVRDYKSCDSEVTDAIISYLEAGGEIAPLVYDCFTGEIVTGFPEHCGEWRIIPETEVERWARSLAQTGPGK